MFGIGGGEFLTLAFIALILIGPNKLPDFAVQSAKFIRRIREVTQGMVNEFKDNLGQEYSDLEVTDFRDHRQMKYQVLIYLQQLHKPDHQHRLQRKVFRLG